MIKKILVKNLFNQANNNYDLDFFADINLLTGRNGSGKTTILKLLWYAISGHFDILVREITFSYLKIVTDKCEIEIDASGNPTYHFSIKYFDKELAQKHNKDFKNFKLLPIIDEEHSTLFFPTFRRIEGGFTIVPKVGEMVENNKIYEAFNELSNRLSRTEMGLVNHKFIAYVSTNDINRRLNDEMAYYSTEKDKITIQQATEIENLAKLGKNEDILTVLENYKKKLTKLEIEFSVLHELVNKHIQKRILLTDKLIIGTGNSTPIPSQRLSAGEKQLFSFLCYNIFAKNSSIFIDEPEISLHPDWQRHLIPLLLKQSSTNQFFITTHSDLIAAPYAHREIELNKDKGK